MFFTSLSNNDIFYLLQSLLYLVSCLFITDSILRSPRCSLYANMVDILWNFWSAVMWTEDSLLASMGSSVPRFHTTFLLVAPTRPGVCPSATGEDKGKRGRTLQSTALGGKVRMRQPRACKDVGNFITKLTWVMGTRVCFLLIHTYTLNNLL